VKIERNREKYLPVPILAIRAILRYINVLKYPTKYFLLTPSEAAEKALIVEQIKAKSRGLWLNGKKTSLPKRKGVTFDSKKKN
jgi:hypothetical protein